MKDLRLQCKCCNSAYVRVVSDTFHMDRLRDFRMRKIMDILHHCPHCDTPNAIHTIIAFDPAFFEEN